MEYLDFETPIKEIEEQIAKCKELGQESKVSVQDTLKKLEKKLKTTSEKVYGKLTPWQKVQLSRHPDRPFTLDYIEAICGDSFIEIFGDRNFADDKAIVGGLGKIDDQTFMFVGHQKGHNTKTRQYRNFAMPNPEGYRKALRLFKMAEKFQIPIVTFIDTPGAYPGLEAEERGQGEAIARNIYEMSDLKTPIISIIIGEGASGGALGIGVGDKVLMLENTWYSVISPESCSSILWRSWEHKETAASSLKLTASDMLENELIDGVIPEPLGGAHKNSEKTIQTVKDTIVKTFSGLKDKEITKLIGERREKFYNMGQYQE